MHTAVIIGAGGHAKVVVELMQQGQSFHPVACVAGNASAGSTVGGVPVVGDDSSLSKIHGNGVDYAFVAIGDNAVRFRLMQHARQLGFKLANAISQHAIISATARIGDNLAIMPGSIVGTDAQIADGVIVNTRASVDHDCVLDEGCHVGPGTTLAGNVHVGRLAFVGTGASVIPGIRIDEQSIVGAGAVVTRDIRANVVAFGVPAREQASRFGTVDVPSDLRRAG